MTGGAPSFTGRAVRALRTRWDVLLVVAAGGALGSLARWGVGLALPHADREFPWSTFSVNVVGCLLIGALMWFEEERWPPSRYRRSFLRTGVLGGFTTFSAYGLDAHTLLLAGAPVVAALYVAGSLVAGLLAVPLGAAGGAGLVALAERGRRPGAAGDAQADDGDGGAGPSSGREEQP
ncbi:fluoride efflux transporter CrcB [Kineosporia sp. A_224]|uniref:fluoride efflux transporter CrcB n=1 Tax=Kineosporia sp. A_224 TaxID=1962180 RepID=UPI0018E9D9C7|nr:fluoride efflux transporter CrcB [Kineosporia sp. A_224]